MTTTITLETHDYPVKADIADIIEGQAEPKISERTIAPRTKEVFHIYNTRSIAFSEMPKPAEDAATE